LRLVEVSAENLFYSIITVNVDKMLYIGSTFAVS